MKNYYSYSQGLPYHLSVGAVIVNDQRQVLCHYYQSIIVGGQDYRDFYILMRETVEPGETLEQTLLRGCKEEMGATVEVEEFMGSLISHHHDAGFEVEKTTLYFKCRLIDQDDSRRSPNDPEKDSQISWQLVADLIKKMPERARRLGREDADESAILKRLSN